MHAVVSTIGRALVVALVATARAAVAPAAGNQVQ